RACRRSLSFRSPPSRRWRSSSQFFLRRMAAPPQRTDTQARSVTIPEAVTSANGGLGWAQQSTQLRQRACEVYAKCRNVARKLRERETAVRVGCAGELREAAIEEAAADVGAIALVEGDGDLDEALEPCAFG